MQILHWPVSYPDPEDGKPYSMIFIAEHIRCANIHHDNVVLVGSQKLPENRRLFQVTRRFENGVRVIRLHQRRTGLSIFDRFLHYFLLGKELAILWWQGFHPDIFHIHIFAEARLPVTLAKWFKIPIVVTEHWTALCRDGFLSARRLAIAKYIYESAEIVLPVCESLRKCIEKNANATIQYQVVPNAVDTSLFYWSPPKEKCSFFQLITVARLEEAKDIPTLLHAVAILRQLNVDFRLSIIGRGDSLPFTLIANELGISKQVEFLGELPKSEIAKRMQQADVFVLSSLWENSPCVIGEALCCGLPVVATAVGGVPELVSEDDGILVPPSKPQTLALALNEVLGHPEKFVPQKITKKAHAKFSYEAIAAQLDAIYTSLALRTNQNAI